MNTPSALCEKEVGERKRCPERATRMLAPPTKPEVRTHGFDGRMTGLLNGGTGAVYDLMSLLPSEWCVCEAHAAEISARHPDWTVQVVS